MKEARYRIPTQYRTQGLIHIIYDHDRYGSMEIMMAQITEEDILTGTIVSPDSKLKICIDRA